MTTRATTRPAARPVVLAVPALLCLLLVASTLLTAPAQAARQRATAVTGWSTAQIVAEPKAVVHLRVGVRPASRRVVRTVQLQWRPDARAAWRTIAHTRTDARGVARLRMHPTAGTVSQIRLAVPRARRAAAAVTAPRVVRALAPAPSGGPTVGVGTAPSLSAPEAEVVRLTNLARGQARSCGSRGRFPAAGPVVAESVLTTVSRAYSLRMGREGFFDHRDPDNKMPWDRANAAGYHANGIGENIAAGYATAEAVLDGWLASPAHCAVLMDARWTEMGIGHQVVDGPRGAGRHYWTQMFGTGGVRR